LFESHSPQSEFWKPSNGVKESIELCIVCRCQLCNQDPDEEIDARAVEMVEEITFDPVPAGYILSFVFLALNGEENLLAFTDHRCLQNQNHFMH
jgi:hypothetical protein